MKTPSHVASFCSTPTLEYLVGRIFLSSKLLSEEFYAFMLLIWSRFYFNFYLYKYFCNVIRGCRLCLAFLNFKYF